MELLNQLKELARIMVKIETELPAHDNVAFSVREARFRINEAIVHARKNKEVK